MRRIIHIVFTSAVIVIFTFFFLQDRQEVGNRPGMMAENFSLPMHGQASGELLHYFGDIIILNLWASWCEPCRNEMPVLMKLQAEYEEEGLIILTVNMQTFERTSNDALEFIEEMKIALPIFFDEEGVVFERYQVAGLPTTYIIGRNGMIEQQILGEMRYEGLKRIINEML